jgi:murein DD-endopeptidase MepM/ murein hydrolase activator NlpD
MSYVITFRRVCIAAAVAVVAVVGGVAAGPVVASPEEQRLDDARQRLEDVRGELADARAARDADARALEVARARVEEVLSAVGEAELAVERQEDAVVEAEERLETAQADVRRRADRTADRIASLYRGAGQGAAASLLTADSPAEVVARSALLDVINRNDRRAFEEAAAARVTAAAQRARVAEERAALQRLLTQQRELLAEVEELRDDRAVALAEREQELGRLESHEAHLTAESRQLAAVAERASAQRASRSPRASRSSSATAGDVSSAPSGGGGWRWPASGTVTSEYGMRWGRLHAGIDIAGGHGSAIMAARSGTVSYTGWMGGYGNLVVVDHGGGLTSAYAHLTSIEARVGQTVSAGQRIGGMGCTGRCTGTHLHFEIRSGGNPQNPRNYLP